MNDIEKLGSFYLGKKVDPSTGGVCDELILYDAKDLTTHALCVGMTGSGKTGLCITMVEEAALDGVPVLAIDPKGDLGNLLLTFPGLLSEDFAPWVDPAAAEAKGMSVTAFAAQTAKQWQEGLADWGQDKTRIERLKNAADFQIITPGSSAGVPLAMLKSMASPPVHVLQDAEQLAEHVTALASALLALIDCASDDRESVLITQLITSVWTSGQALDLKSLITGIQKPPFAEVGVFDLESFFPAKERTALALRFNQLLASPNASRWLEGEPLDMGKLLWTESGKPRVTILSIAHLSEPERMFVVTSVISEMVNWMRQQSGTSSLRALVYMDEIWGFMPPTAEPPSKKPLLTLLKQARAFGVGVMLATQNPVDLDYKGLSNCGTWFIGRLQAERDKQRLLDGLESAQGGRAMDRSALDQMISGLKSRVFVMNNVHDDGPVLFQTRWTMSYLRGPMNRDDIKRVSANTLAPLAPIKSIAQPPQLGSKPLVASTLPELYAASEQAIKTPYRPVLVVKTKLHFVKGSIDQWQDFLWQVPLQKTDAEPAWNQGQIAAPEFITSTVPDPQPGANFLPVPAALSNAKTIESWRKAFERWVIAEKPLVQWESKALKLKSKPDELRGEFVARLSLVVRQARDARVDELRSKYGIKLTQLQEKLRKAQSRTERERSQAQAATVSTALSVGTTLLGALFGRKAISMGQVGRASTAARSAGRVIKERQDIQAAEADEASLQTQIQTLETDLAKELEALDVSSLSEITELQIAPRKNDIDTLFTLIWTYTGESLY